MSTSSICVFQSTLPRRSDHNPCNLNPQRNEFQSTLPRRSDLNILGKKFTDRFQSTLPRRSDRLWVSVPYSLWRFQSTLPRRSDGCPERYNHPKQIFQSTLPRRSDTFDRLKSSNGIFQSTLPRRSDVPWKMVQTWPHNFNPRSREGATMWMKPMQPYRSNFNPRSREGATRLPLWNFLKLRDFNPRSREGATRRWVRIYRGGQISIHAPAKERLYLLRPVWITERFQSTLPRRSDFLFQRELNEADYFNPRSREGATQHDGKIVCQIQFQSTLPRRSDQLRCTLYNRETISIHAPAKERLHLSLIFFLQHTIFSHISHKSYF